MHGSFKDRTGEVNANNNGSKMIIEKYNGTHDVWVKFIESGHLVHTSWGNFLKGNVRNPFEKTIYGIGYLGYEKDKSYKGENKSYQIWINMLERCYGEKNRHLNPSYENCVVNDEWHNYQNFAKWFEENYYEVDGEKMHLDKDILFKNNKIYSSDTCIFAPERINTLFTNRKSNKGEYPVGVHCYSYKNTIKYIAKISQRKKRIYLGIFNTVEEAFSAYKTAKENYVREVAEEFKNEIPIILYEALYNYKVNIND